MNPKVFVSHATEDKDRFVLEFATRLRANGVDAWVDRWEMLPGDSLVDKIFEEGIKNAQAVIVVLSNYSITKNWVREELNAAVVKKLNKASKLIPVIIDDCEVPEALKSTVWERIADVQHYDKEFERILMSIYGKYEKPPLGSGPQYAELSVDALPDLTSVDTLVFKTACEIVIAEGMPFLNTEPMMERLKHLGIGEDVLAESLEILDGRGYVKAVKSSSGAIPAFSIQWSGLEEYLRYYLPRYGELVDAVAYKIVNEHRDNNETISNELGQPKMIINNILETLENRGLIHLAKAMGGHYFITDVGVELKRMLRSGDPRVDG